MTNFTTEFTPPGTASGWSGASVGAGVPAWSIFLGAAFLAAMGGLLIAVAEVNALLLCVSLLACLFIMMDFRIGVMLLIVLLPISSSSLFPRSIGGITGFNPLNLLLLMTLFSTLLRGPGAARLGAVVPRSLLWLYVLPLVIAGLLGVRHVDAIAAELHVLEMIQFDNAGGYLRDMLVKPLFLVGFALLAGVTVVGSRRLEILLYPLVLSVWLMCLMAVVLVYLSGASLGELASSGARAFFSPLGMHANDLGRFYAIAYALMLFTCARTTDLSLRWLLVASMGLVVVALTLTFSRGAFLGFVMVNILFLMSRGMAATLLLGSLFAAALVFLLPGAVYDRLGTGWEGGLNAISAGRVDEIWLPLLAEFWNSPLFGHGLGSILWSDAMHAGTILQVTHPHNAYLQALLDMGLLGLVLVCAYFVHVLRGFRALSKAPDLSPEQQGFYQGAAAGLVSFLLAGFAGSSLLPVLEQSFLWLAIGMMYGEHARRKAA